MPTSNISRVQTSEEVALTMAQSDDPFFIRVAQAATSHPSAWASVRNAWMSNPNTPLDLLLPELEAGRAAAWQNPIVDLLLLTEPRSLTHKKGLRNQDIRKGACQYLCAFFSTEELRQLSRDLRTEWLPGSSEKHALLLALEAPTLPLLLQLCTYAEWLRLRPLVYTGPAPLSRRVACVP